MKKFFKMGLGIAVLLCFFAVSCQDEVHEIFVNSDALTNNSAVTKLLKRVAQTSVVDDNTIDSATCFKIKLPVELTVNGQVILVQNEEGYQQAADILNASNGDDDEIIYGFPITIISNDNGAETAVNNSDEYEALRQQCPMPPAEIPINCIDFNYPFTVSLYDPNFQNQQIFTINNDSELYAFLVNLTSGQLYQINFPVSAVIDNATIEINNNTELQDAINQAIDVCSNNSNPCDTQNTDFQQIYNDLAANNEELITMDLPTHEYTFIPQVNGTICSIGYEQTEVSDEPITYLIQIVNVDNFILYEGNHTFSTTETQYYTIPTVSIFAGQQYRIRRTRLGNGNYIGRLLRSDTPFLPSENNNILIQNARFYAVDGNVPPVFDLLPFIDFVFTPD